MKLTIVIKIKGFLQKRVKMMGRKQTNLTKPQQLEQHRHENFSLGLQLFRIGLSTVRDFAEQGRHDVLETRDGCQSTISY